MIPKHERLPILGIALFVSMSAGFGMGRISSNPNQTEEAIPAQQPAPPQPLTYEQIRQAVWDGIRICGASSLWNSKAMPETYPDEKWCKAWRARLKAQEEERRRERDLDELKHCIQEGGRSEDFKKYGFIDRVDDPRWHYSWVLEGECETLAHRVQAQYGICQGWVDDDHVRAETCRLEMKAYVEKFCARDDISDTFKRECANKY